MPLPDRMLVATDFSRPSMAAGRLAARLATDGTDVTVLHAARMSGPADSDGLEARASHGRVGVAPPSRLAPPAADVAVLHEQLATWCRETRLERASQRVVFDRPAKAVARIAQETSASLVLLGATGRGRVARVMLGTTATAVAHDVNADVIVVRQSPRQRDEAIGEPPDIRRVVIATDFSSASERAARRAMQVAATFGAEVTLLHVRDRTLVGTALYPAEAEPRLRTFNRDHLGGVARERLDEGHAAHAIRRALVDEDADLLAIGTHGTDPGPHHLLGFVARSLIESAPCSVLVARRIG